MEQVMESYLRIHQKDLDLFSEQVCNQIVEKVSAGFKQLPKSCVRIAGRMLNTDRYPNHTPFGA